MARARRVKFNGRGAFWLDFSLLPTTSKRVLSSVINLEKFDYSSANNVYRAFRIYQQTTYLQRVIIVSCPSPKSARYQETGIVVSDANKYDKIDCSIYDTEPKPLGQFWIAMLEEPLRI